MSQGLCKYIHRITVVPAHGAVFMSKTHEYNLITNSTRSSDGSVFKFSPTMIIKREGMSEWNCTMTINCTCTMTMDCPSRTSNTLFGPKRVATITVFFTNLGQKWKFMVHPEPSKEARKRQIKSPHCSTDQVDDRLFFSHFKYFLRSPTTPPRSYYYCFVY
jgi:hypothetical protein